MKAHPLVRFRHVSKSFPGVRALNDVSFEIWSGEVHALMGENGAGKSTLMKILAGACQPDSGVVEIDGQPVHLHSPAEATRLGIGMIYQELTVLPNLDVARNLLLGREPLKWLWQVDNRRLYSMAAQILHDLDLKIDPHTPLDALSPGERQMVEIARVVAREPRILIMDEPTSSLGKHEEDVLFKLIHRLRSRNIAIVYISHRMDEVFLLADRVTVLRDGSWITTQPVHELSRPELIRLMVGRAVEETRQNASPHPNGELILEARGLRCGKRLRNGNVTLRRGEVLGVAGLIGAGRTEMARVLFGIDQPEAGEIRIDGRRVAFRSPADAIRHGIAYVPEDRKKQGLVLSGSVRFNLILASLREMARGGFLRPDLMEALYTHWREQLRIRAPSSAATVESLSGGNQQKVVLARWLARRPRILILDEPTRGIDVGAKTEVHRLIREVASQGIAVMMISSELPEILAVSDRILVMWNGETTGELDAATAAEEDVMALAFGETNSQAR